MHLHLRVADLADAVDDPAERSGESPGVERPSRVVEVVDVPGGDARRGRTVRRGEGDLVLDQDAAPGKESLRDPEAELAAVWKGANALTPQRAVGLVTPDALKYLHPGAQKFFKEKGALK